MKKQYVLFKIGSEMYAVLINFVIEITDFSKTTKIPGSKEHIDGIVRLRDEVISIINLRKRLKLDYKKKCKDKNKVLVVQKNKKKFGLIVDEAKDIKRFDKSLIQKNTFSGQLNERFVKNIINTSKKTILILDINEIIR
ncbi:MAG: chemotaxis protein CheW [Bacillota bacterium]